MASNSSNNNGGGGSGSSSSTNRTVTLRASDGEEFVVDWAMAMQSEIIKNYIADCDSNTTTSSPTKQLIVPLLNVTSAILVYVIEYCNKHAGSTQDVVGLNGDWDDDCKYGPMRPSSTSEWDAAFLKQIDQNTLFDLILAANYLNIKGLLELTCRHVADSMKNKTPEQLRAIFHIKNDYNEEELNEVKREITWALQ